MVCPSEIVLDANEEAMAFTCKSKFGYMPINYTFQAEICKSKSGRCA